MGFITKRITDNTIFHLKAPRGFFYDIKSIMWTVITLETGVTVFIFDRAVEEPGNLTHGSYGDSAFLLLPLDLITQGQFFFSDFKRKYITLAGHNSLSSGSVKIVIEYKLFKPSRVEALLEWFRRGR